MITIWMIGHSTRSSEEFLSLLQEHSIQALADIRRFPTSRWGQFKQPNLRATLEAAGIGYRHVADLGGFRSSGYVEFMQTPEFAAGIESLLAIAAQRRTSIMCAEAVFFRCHRRYVSDALARRGVAVLHIMAPGKTYRHKVVARLDEHFRTIPPKNR